MSREGVKKSLQPKVSIVVPLYNSMPLLKRLVDGLRNQTFSQIEILLIDNGSDDGSLEVCKEYSKVDQRIKVFTCSKKGPSAARNVGLSNTKGECVVFVDSDDAVHEKYIENLYKTINTNNAELGCCGYRVIKENKCIFQMSRTISGDKYLEIIQNYQGFLFNKIYKKEIIEKNRIRFDEEITMSEDLLFNYNYLRFCNKVGYSEKCYYDYYEYPDSTSRSFRVGWFDILSVYSTILKDLPKMSKGAQERLAEQYILIVSEAKMRCRIMKLKYDDMCKERQVDVLKLKNLYRNVIRSGRLSFKDKLKLFVFVKLNYIAQVVKFRRIV